MREREEGERGWKGEDRSTALFSRNHAGRPQGGSSGAGRGEVRGEGGEAGEMERDEGVRQTGRQERGGQKEGEEAGGKGWAGDRREREEKAEKARKAAETEKWKKGGGALPGGPGAKLGIPLQGVPAIPVGGRTPSCPFYKGREREERER